MKVGLVHFMAYPQCMSGAGPILESVAEVIADPFFEVLEITHIDKPDVRNEVKQRLDQSRMDVYFGAQPILLGGGLDLNSLDDAERKKAIDAVVAGIDEAAEIGAKAVAVLSGKVSDDREDAKARLVDSLNQLCAHASKSGLPVVLETFDQVPYGKNCLIGSTKDAVAVSEAVRKDHPNFGVMLDLSHLPLQNEEPKDAVAAAGNHLVHAHIGNCAMDDPNHPAYGDNHPRFGAPGTRNDAPELTEFLRVLWETGYLSKENRKVVSFEVKPMAGESSTAVIAGSKRTLLEAWRNV